jgi:hypothetical protein
VAKPPQTRDGLHIVGIRDGDDDVTIGRVIQLGKRHERRAHRRFQLFEDRVEQNDERIVALVQILGLFHIDVVHRKAEQVEVDEEAQRVEALRKDVRVHQVTVNILMGDPARYLMLFGFCSTISEPRSLAGQPPGCT